MQTDSRAKRPFSRFWVGFGAIAFSTFAGTLGTMTGPESWLGQAIGLAVPAGVLVIAGLVVRSRQRRTELGQRRTRG